MLVMIFQEYIGLTELCASSVESCGFVSWRSLLCPGAKHLVVPGETGPEQLIVDKCKSLWTKVSPKCINVNINLVKSSGFYFRFSYMHCLYGDETAFQTRLKWCYI